MQVIPDIIAEQRYQRGDSGEVRIRVFEVRELPTVIIGTAYVDPLARAKTAVDSVTGVAVPQYGEEHPTINTLFVDEVTIEHLRTAHKARVYVHYSNRRALGLVDIRINGTSVLTQTQKGADGKQLITYYRIPSPGDAMDQWWDFNGAAVPITDPDYTKTVQRELAIVPVHDATFTLGFTYDELGNPGAKAGAYVNRLNSSTWQGEQPYTWRCRAICGKPYYIKGMSLADPLVWRVDYEFEFKPWDPAHGRTGHKAIGTLKDANTGVEHPDMEDPVRGLTAGRSYGNGWGLFQPYPTADFAGLALADVSSL